MNSTLLPISENQIREMIAQNWTEYQSVLKKSIGNDSVEYRTRLKELRELHDHLMLNKNRMIKGFKVA